MEHPEKDIVPIIHSLTQDLPTQQKETLEYYFTPTASFTHPFCATGSWTTKILGTEFQSRWAILQIYQWYKLISPQIQLDVLSTAFDQENLLLYVTIHQHFRLWMVPFYDASVKLTTVLQLAEGDASGPQSAKAASRGAHGSRGRVTKGRSPYSYAAVVANSSIPGDNDEKESDNANQVNGQRYFYITQQNDLYQTSEWIKFLLPWGIGSTLMVAWQLYATFMCILGAYVFYPFTWWKERSVVDAPRKI